MKTTSLVVEAQPGDIEAMIDIHAACFHRGWSESEFDSLLKDRSVLSLVLRRSRFREKDKVIGFVLARIVLDEAEILTIAVHPDHQQTGAGLGLMEAIIRNLYGNRIAKLFLEVDASNQAALSLYKKLGFEKVGERKGYYQNASGDPSLAWIMQVSVSP